MRSTASPHVVRCTPHDAAELRACLRGAPAERELPGSAVHSYLDERIAKPWGSEIRVYDDRWIDVWQLFVEAGRGTSLHAHPRKDTYLVCVDGEGALLTGAGDAIALVEGTVLRISAGALHASVSTAGMSLLEVELPRDKLDLVRIDDRYGRTGEPYEPECASRAPACPLLAAPAGPPQARLRRRPAGNLRFELETGREARRDPRDLAVAISLEPHAVLSRDLTVLTRATVRAMAPDELFLTVRRTHR